MNQLGRVNAQPRCQLEQVVQAQVAPSSLDLPEECPVDAGLMGQGFLAELQGYAAGADAFAKRLSGWGEWFGHIPPTTYVPTVYVQSNYVPCFCILISCGPMSAPVGSLR